VLVVSGGPGRTGAARLAARGALRIGAGAVTIGVPPAAQLEVACQITAIMLARVSDAMALDHLLQDCRINALCLGPGLGLGDEKRDLIEVALKSGRACVLDADACTLIAQCPALFAALHSRCVLTPHGGEFARLFPQIAERLAAGDVISKNDATREAAQKAGCVVLLKGAETMIADQHGLCQAHLARAERAVPWLATAGSGDVLTGFIAGLIARGLPVSQAAGDATWLHTECALRFGPGLIAEDLSEELPRVLRQLAAEISSDCLG